MSTQTARSLPPFLDFGQNDYSEMYRHLPYKKDIVLCPPEMIRLCTGNVVKYYEVTEEDTVIIDTNDLAEHLVDLGKAESRRFHSNLIAVSEQVIDEEDILQAALSAGKPDVSALFMEHSPAYAQDAVQASAQDKASAQVSSSRSESAAVPAPEPVILNSFSDVSEDDDDFSFLRK